MSRNKIEVFLLIFFLLAGILGFFSLTASPVMGEEGKSHLLSSGTGDSSINDKENNQAIEAMPAKQQKQVFVGEVPLGTKRSELIKLFSEKNITPLLRTAPMDIFPRLIGEIPYIQKAYLYYTKDQVSKIEIIFKVPIDPKTMTGAPIFDYYGELRQELIRLFGQPTNTTAHVHPNFPYKLVALETGNAYFFDYWENVSDMKVLLSLKGAEGEINFSLIYQYLPLFE